MTFVSYCTLIINNYPLFLFTYTSIETVCFFPLLEFDLLCVNPFDPGGSYCYWDSIKPCKSNEFRFMAYGSVTRG